MAEASVSGGEKAGASWNTPATQEAWGNLAKQMEPSQGPYSGGFTKGGTASPQGSQWMRQISLVVYGAPASGTGLTMPDKTSGTSAATPSGRIIQGYADTIDLPEKVTAKAPEQKPPEPQKAPQGLELGALRVTFNVHKSTATTPTILEARIYNMSPQTMKKVVQFGRVQLSAGYKFGQYGVIFDGTVVQYRIGRENPTDTYIEIRAGDRETSQATSFMRIEAGKQEKEAIPQLVKDTGIPAGYISPKVGTDKLLRPWIIAGPTQKYLRDLMLKYNAQCFPDLNKLHIVQQRELLPGETVILSPRTGLIGIPEATPEGIQIRCLLNPRLKLGGSVQLDNKLITGQAFIPGGKVADPNIDQWALDTGGKHYSLGPPVPTSPVGTYKIFMLEISGDTRGLPWYCDLICLALDENGNLYGPSVPGSVFSRQPAALPS